MIDEETRSGMLVRILVGESDRWKHRALWEEILERARAADLAGATVLRGIAGFGASSRVHTSKILRLSQDLPVVIEIVDSEEAIVAFRPTIEALVGEGLITVERVQIWAYRGRTTEDEG